MSKPANEMSDAMKEMVLQNARAWHQAANAAPGLAQENLELRQALRNAREEMRQRGITTRSFAAICRISAAQLSEWTGELPTTPPDFIEYGAG